MTCSSCAALTATLGKVRAAYDDLPSEPRLDQWLEFGDAIQAALSTAASTNPEDPWEIIKDLHVTRRDLLSENRLLKVTLEKVRAIVNDPEAYGVARHSSFVIDLVDAISAKRIPTPEVEWANAHPVAALSTAGAPDAGQPERECLACEAAIAGNSISTQRARSAEAASEQYRERLALEEKAHVQEKTLHRATWDKLQLLQAEANKACSVWEHTPSHSLHDVRQAMNALRTAVGAPTRTGRKPEYKLVEAAGALLHAWHEEGGDDVVNDAFDALASALELFVNQSLGLATPPEPKGPEQDTYPIGTRGSSANTPLGQAQRERDELNTQAFHRETRIRGLKSDLAAANARIAELEGLLQQAHECWEREKARADDAERQRGEMWGLCVDIKERLTAANARADAAEEREVTKHSAEAYMAQRDRADAAERDLKDALVSLAATGMRNSAIMTERDQLAARVELLTSELGPDVARVAEAEENVLQAVAAWKGAADADGRCSVVPAELSLYDAQLTLERIRAEVDNASES